MIVYRPTDGDAHTAAKTAALAEEGEHRHGQRLQRRARVVADEARHPGGGQPLHLPLDRGSELLGLSHRDAVGGGRHQRFANLGGDGYGGDGATTAPEEAGVDVPRALPGGDGATGLAPAAPAGDEEDIRFWRDADGTLRMNVPHVQKHSQAPEISYLGSGPADAALSVLCAVTSREEAERLYQFYKVDVIARLDPDGAALTRASVRAWLDRQTGERPDGHGT